MYEALNSVHSKGYYHGDFNPCNMIWAPLPSIHTVTNPITRSGTEGTGIDGTRIEGIIAEKNRLVLIDFRYRREYEELSQEEISIYEKNGGSRMYYSDYWFPPQGWKKHDLELAINVAKYLAMGNFSHVLDKKEKILGYQDEPILAEKIWKLICMNKDERVSQRISSNECLAILNS